VRILALETSTRRASVALIGEGAPVLAEAEPSQHAETIVGMIDEVLARAGVRRDAIELVAVGLGPGSFTGVRVGVATAKGIALGLGVRIVGVRTSQIVAASVRERVVVALDGKKGEVFASAWARHGDTLVCTHEDVHGDPRALGAQLRERLGGGPLRAIGSSELLDALADGLRAGGDASTERVMPSALVLATEAQAAFAARGADDLASLEPLYVRAADVTMKAPS
jgi:tRNA threonylcarbamoyladenosine biosynthesis protein TsaB